MLLKYLNLLLPGLEVTMVFLHGEQKKINSLLPLQSIVYNVLVDGEESK